MSKIVSASKTPRPKSKISMAILRPDCGRAIGRALEASTVGCQTVADTAILRPGGCSEPRAERVDAKSDKKRCLC